MVAFGEAQVIGVQAGFKVLYKLLLQLEQIFNIQALKVFATPKIVKAIVTKAEVAATREARVREGVATEGVSVAKGADVISEAPQEIAPEVALERENEEAEMTKAMSKDRIN